jgi:aspartate aminotransferase-like enzyme
LTFSPAVLEPLLAWAPAALALRNTYHGRLMAAADLDLPVRLLAGGGPSSPHPRVLRALGLPVVGQFDPEFTAIMDDVMDLARRTLLTTNRHSFAVSGLAAAGLEAVLNSLVEDGDRVAIAGGSRYTSQTAEIARRCGARVVAIDELGHSNVKLAVAPVIESTQGTLVDVRQFASAWHARGARVVVDATLGLAACELRVDDWGIDVCVAGADYAVGAPSGMALVTYSPEVEALMHARRNPPRTSYLDLLQLQAYWSPERLNHHTAPTSLVYGLREALRLAVEEGLEQRWERHRRIGQTLQDGLAALGLDVQGDPPYAIIHLPDATDENRSRRRLLEEFGVHVTHIGERAWRLGLLGADARPDAVQLVLAAVEKVLG